MKTYLNLIKQFRTAIMLFGMCVLVSYGCKQVNNPLESSNEKQSIEGLNINVKYAESYDQTEITYSRLWPKGISEGLNKQSSSGGELLVDYERTREVLAFNEEGYMNSVTEFLEGDGEMNMPEEAYNNLKSTMPAKSADHDPVVKTVMQDGKSKSYTKSGELKYESTYDPEEFRVDPVLLEQLGPTDNDTSDVDQNIQKNIEGLTNNGIAFDIVDGFYAKYQISASTQAQEDDIPGYLILQDLRTGDIVSSAMFRPDGKYRTITFNRYKLVENTSILAYSEKFKFGEISGKWGVIERSVLHRENIKVIK